jgi:hypothetical protein
MVEPNPPSPNKLRQQHARRLRGRYAGRLARKTSLREMANAVVIEAAERWAPRQR